MNYSLSQIKRAKIAGKGAFLLTGMGIAPWASIMPFVKDNLELNELYYTFLLLCFGIGAVVGMPLAGPLSKKFGVKRVLTLSFVSLFICVAAISIPSIDYISCALVIVIWGASLGVTEVANNIHGTYFEEISKEHMLSGFHAFETIGCLLAAFVFPILLVLDIQVFYVSLCVCIPSVILSLCIDRGLLNTHGIKEEKSKNNVQKLPVRTLIVVSGFACMLMYLCEGLVYDWSGVYLFDKCKVSLNTASLGYVFFQITVALFRLKGDLLINLIGPTKVLVIGSIFAFISLFLISLSHNPYVVIVLFALLGICVANIVPVIISNAAQNCGEDKAKAISLVGTLGYAGVMIGPAVLGFIASIVSLDAIFAFSGFLMIVMGALCFVALKHKSKVN
ncbi:MAG: MFS transporter [Succinivibrio sp.]|nr:MFS transporter [Succinivibrio sp.]